MIPLFAALRALSLLTLGTSLLNSIPVSASGDAGIRDNTIQRRESDSAPLTGDVEPSPSDFVHRGKWKPYWFDSVQAAYANALPEELAECWTNTGGGGGGNSDPTTSADFYLTNKDGERKDFNIAWKNVLAINKADFSEDDPKWWMAGQQHAAVLMGGYTGLEKDKMTNDGDPKDAFKMLINVKPEDLLDYEVEDNWEELWNILTVSDKQPTIIHLSDEAEESTMKEGWYACLNGKVYENEQVTGKPWDVGGGGQIEYAAGEKKWSKPLPFGVHKEKIQRVIQLKAPKP